MSPDQIFVLALVLVVFVLFFKEIFPPEVTALGASAALLATGIISTDEFLKVFSSAAPITIAMMFILSAALERTGVIAGLGDWLRLRARGSYMRAMILMMGTGIVTSAFMNNTPVVVLLTPVMIAVAGSVGAAPSRFLIPLSFAAIFGGTLTVIGTSTNVLMSTVATEAGQPAIGMFEMTGPGLIFAACGAFYMIFAGRYLLPDRVSLAAAVGRETRRQFMARVLVPAGSKYIGKTVDQMRSGIGVSRVIDVIRAEVSLRHELAQTILQPGDRVVVKADEGDFLKLGSDGQIRFRDLSGAGIEAVTAETSQRMEASVGPESPFVGQRLRDLRLRRKYGVYVVAVHSGGQNAGHGAEDIVLNFGDTLLLEGPAEGMNRLLADGGIVNLSAPQAVELRRGRAWIAVLSILSVVVLAAFDVMPIAGLAVIAAVAVMMTRCVDPDEAFGSIDWRILFLIFGMLGLSKGLENTGVITMAVEWSEAHMAGSGPIVLLAFVYILTSILTEFLSNNAVAVLVGPLAINVAVHLGYDPRAFIMAVMFAASASFATPIGYQTNTFVYGAGGYKFRDFVVVGVPLNILFAVLAIVFLPMFFPF